MSQSPELAATPARVETSPEKLRKSKKRKQPEQGVAQLGFAIEETPLQHKKKRRRRDAEQVSHADHGNSYAPSRNSSSSPTLVRQRPVHSAADELDQSSQAQAGRDEETTAPSPFFEQTTSFYLALSPIGQLHPLESLCAEHLSPLLLTYYPPLRGVVISYKNPRFTNDDANSGPALARSINEYAVSYTWVTADFTVFRPAKGAIIEGHITVQNESHVALLCWNLFNASIEAKRLASSWRWIGAPGPRGGGKSRQSQPVHLEDSVVDEDGIIEGYYVDNRGTKVEETVKFTVRDFETSAQDFGKDKGYMSIEGTLLTEEEEEQLAKTEAALANGTVNGSGASRQGKKRPKERNRPE